MYLKKEIMAQHPIMICKKCGETKIIVNKTKCLCDDCNFKRLHDGLSRFQYKLLNKPFKSRTEIKKMIRRRKLHSPTGERELFAEIWKERPHVCTHCGTELPEPARSYYFSHIKSKGAFPELRLEKSNIELTCLKCHQDWEFGNRQINK